MQQLFDHRRHRAHPVRRRRRRRDQPAELDRKAKAVPELQRQRKHKAKAVSYSLVLCLDREKRLRPLPERLAWAHTQYAYITCVSNLRSLSLHVLLRSVGLACVR